MICIATIPITNELAYDIYTKNLTVVVNLALAITNSWEYCIKLLSPIKCYYRDSYISNICFYYSYYEEHIPRCYFAKTQLAIIYGKAGVISIE